MTVEFHWIVSTSPHVGYKSLLKGEEQFFKIMLLCMLLFVFIGWVFSFDPNKNIWED